MTQRYSIIDGYTQVERAEQIARLAHADQKDKQGEPYITHVERVANSVEGALLKTVAWLHDVLEDHGDRWTAFDLLRHGIEPAAVDAVQIVTKEKDEPYPRFIARIVASGNKVALAVKTADVDDHLMGRGPGGCPQHMVGRYRAAIEELRRAA